MPLVVGDDDDDVRLLGFAGRLRKVGCATHIIAMDARIIRWCIVVSLRVKSLRAQPSIALRKASRSAHFPAATVSAVNGHRDTSILHDSPGIGSVRRTYTEAADRRRRLALVVHQPFVRCGRVAGPWWASMHLSYYLPNAKESRGQFPPSSNTFLVSK